MAGPAATGYAPAPGLAGLTDEEAASKAGFNDIFGEVMAGVGRAPPSSRGGVPGLPSSRSTAQQSLADEEAESQMQASYMAEVDSRMNSKESSPPAADDGENVPGDDTMGVPGANQDFADGGSGTDGGMGGGGPSGDAGSGTAGAGQSGEGGQWKKGGPTGNDGDRVKDEPRGTVHEDEHVFDREATEAIGVDRLERMRQIAKSKMPQDKKMVAIGKLFTSRLAMAFPKDAA